AYVDILSSPPGRLDPASARIAVAGCDGFAPFKGGEILLSRAAIERAGGIAIDEEGEPLAELWPHLAEIGASIALIGRPVVFQFAPVCSTPGKLKDHRLTVAALNDKGFSGGAG